MLFCSNCGKQVTQNAKFCSNCGNEIVNKSVNKIDNTIDSILSKTNSIKEEVNQSYYYNQAKEKNIPVFMKEELLGILKEDEFVQEFPKEFGGIEW